MAPPKRYPKSNRRKDGLRLVARDHATALLKKPAAYYDDSLNVTWGSQDQYEVIKQLGKGKYGEVYEGINLRLASRDKDRVCVIKGGAFQQLEQTTTGHVRPAFGAVHWPSDSIG